MTVTIQRDGPTGLVTLNNPPVNAIGLAVREGLQAAIDWAAAEPGLTRVILTGAGRTFAAGGDAREFDADPVAPHLPDLVDQIEASEIPWIAAINGVALGGGCELALACRYRIAVPAAQIGLPEVTLGVTPGAGGTQRLPRLIGVKAALDMIVTGKPVSATTAEAIGLIDGIADDPVSVAQRLDIGTLARAMPICDLPAPAPNDAAVQAARDKAPAHQIALQNAIELVAITPRIPLAHGLPMERDSFLTLRKTPQARALRHIFFAERAAKAPASLPDPAPLDHIAIVGGGTMGAGIAYALLNAGSQITLLETDQDAITRATENVEKIIAASVKRGLLQDRDSLRARLTITTDYAKAASATLAIEAAFEAMEVKHTIFQNLATHLPGAILATNTSYLDLNAIAAATPDPSRVIGLHFFAPAHIMKLLEIVKGDATSDRALATGYAVAKRLRKIPVTAGVCDGFIGNRILARYREAADTLLMDATTPWEIDEIMEGFGYAMGPYAAQDLSGLDIAHANRHRADATRDPARRYIPIADRMVAEGRLGRKTGAGWYRYPGGGGKVIDPLTEDLIREEADFARAPRADLPDDQIRDTLLVAMINEAADILHEGIAASASDIDLVTVLGYGFPRWRGGLMHYADTIGAAKIVAKIQLFARKDPIAWKVSPALQHCADTKTALADYKTP